jgi:hypothetical protein
MDRLAQLREEYPSLTKMENGETVTLTDDEYEATLAAWVAAEQAVAAAEAERQAAEEAKAAAKASALAKLEALGLTADEASALLGV